MIKNKKLFFYISFIIKLNHKIILMKATKFLFIILAASLLVLTTDSFVEARSRGKVRYSNRPYQR